MKKIFILSQVLLAINIFVLIVPTSAFLIAFQLFPNLDATENGLGVYPLLFMIYRFAGLFVTIPLLLVMIVAYMWYKYKFTKKD